MRSVYLDQNKWIELARVKHGKEKDPGLVTLLAFIEEAKTQRLLQFPLSLSHYLETLKQTAKDRRWRLAQTMVEFSGLDTLADLDALVRHELERALARRFGDEVRPRPFTLIGKGIGHATGRSLGLTMNDRAGVLKEEERERIETWANAVFQMGALAGADNFGGPRDLQVLKSDAGKRFVEILNEIPPHIALMRQSKVPMPEEGLRWYFVGRVLSDIRPVIEEVLRHHRLEHFMPMAYAMKRGEAVPPDGGNLLEWIAIIEECPSRRVDMHILKQFGLNPSLKREPNDLNDVAYTGAAASVCDIVVCEKQMADILNRPGLNKKAIVLRDVRDLLSV